MSYNPEKLRRRYPAGSEITLEYMEGQPQMHKGLKGKVTFIDDIGQIHVDWENGSTLELNPELDKFQAKRPSLEVKKEMSGSRKSVQKRPFAIHSDLKK